MQSNTDIQDLLKTKGIGIGGFSNIVDELDSWLLSTILKTTFGAYQPSKLLHKSEMSLVFLAERVDGQFEQTVVIKFLSPGSISDSTRMAFEQECALLGKLEHKNICRIINAELNDSMLPYIVLEYSSGIDIEEYIKKNSLSIPERIKLIINLCQIIEYFHSHFIVHNDLKPHNILVEAGGFIKVLDFGVSGLDQKSRILKSYTPMYSSDSQVESDISTTSTDIHQLGLILSKLFFDFLPTELKIKKSTKKWRLPQIMSNHNIFIENAKNLLSKYSCYQNELYIKDIFHIILRSTSENTLDAYLNLTELRADLEKVFNVRSIRSKVGGLVFKFFHRNIKAIIVAFAFLFALGSFGFLYIVDINIQKNLAKRNEKIAQATSSYLSQILVNVDTNLDTAKEISFREVIDHASENLLTNEELDPNVKVELASTISNSYTRLQQYEKAEVFIDYALKNVTPNSLVSKEKVHRLKILKFQSLYDQGNAEEALLGVSQLLEENDGRLNTDNHVLALKLKAESLNRLGRLDESLKVLEIALLLASHLNSATADNLAAQMANLSGIIFIKKREFTKAITNLEEASKFYDVSDRRNSLQHLTVKGNLAILLNISSRPTEAKVLLQETISLLESKYASRHSLKASHYTTLAEVEFELGNVGLALDIATKAEELYIEAMGPESFKLIALYKNMTKYLSQLGQCEKAQYYKTMLNDLSSSYDGPKGSCI
ncbi:MAG: protein kinase [Oceanospirillaceae bacterium]|nr:protein kinase [Oceanospirillaceae bacterium]